MAVSTCTVCRLEKPKHRTATTGGEIAGKLGTPESLSNWRAPQDTRPKSLHRYLAHNVLRTEVVRKEELFTECEGGGFVLRSNVLARVMIEGDRGSI